jgi:uracil-DNA glycosylase family 4
MEFTCSKCDICLINNHRPIIGDGNLNANIMFITRNPSSLELKNNIPMISKDGLLFQQYLDLFNFDRDLIYITNAVKCRTPAHRYPTDREIYNCYEHLDNDIKTVNPKIIVLLGDTATRAYFKLAYTNLSIHIDSLNAQYMIHKDRIILFMISPYHGIYNVNGRIAIYHAFVSLLRLYRIINPAHLTNINL